MSINTIEVINVSKSFGPHKVVNNVSLAIPKGEFFSLLGPSGCGKTTLLRIIAGFEKPDSGQVLINGEDVTNLPVRERDVNMVFQSYALFPNMTVEQNVAFGLQMQQTTAGEIKQKTAQILQMVRMNTFAKSLPGKLSGGQQQRVALARALVTHPSALLLDEPLSALDAKLRQELQREIREIQKQINSTFILVTHDQFEALSMSDRVAVMVDGKIEQIDSPEEIYNSPASKFVAEFIGESNFFTGNILEINPSFVQVELFKSWKVQLNHCLNYNLKHSPNTLINLFLRPENIALSMLSSESDLSAEIIDFSFAGRETRYYLKISDNNYLCAIEQGHPKYAKFSKVTLQIPTSAIRLIEGSMQ